MTPFELKAIRIRLGLTGADFARLLGYQGARGPQQVYKLETGRSTITNQVQRLATAYRDGYRPTDWPD